MRAKFSYEKKDYVDVLRIFFVVAFIVGITNGLWILLPVFLIVFFLFCPVIFRYDTDGVIAWEQDSIVICRMKENEEVPRWTYTLDEIESVSCTPEIMHIRRYEIIHILIFTVMFTSGKKRTFCFELDIDENFPVQQPEKYKEYIDEQPLMQLCNYINERLDKDKNEKMVQ